MIPLVAAVQLKQTSHEVAAAPTGCGDLCSSEPTTATLCQSFSSVVEIRVRASKQDSELGRPGNLCSLHSLQCNPICIKRELHTDQTIQASSSSTSIMTEYVLF
jgi:hypothetical protein